MRSAARSLRGSREPGVHHPIVGEYSIVVYVKCGRCPYIDVWSWASGSGRTPIQDSLRKDGWKKTKEFGWICSNCVEELGRKP